MKKALEILGKTLFPATNGNIAKFLKDNDTFSITVNMTVEAMEEYAKYCASKARDYYLREGVKVLKNEIDNFTDWEVWWSEFQRKEEAK